MFGVKPSDEDVAEIKCLRVVPWKPFFGFLYMGCTLVNTTELSMTALSMCAGMRHYVKLL